MFFGGNVASQKFDQMPFPENREIEKKMSPIP